MWTTEGRSSFTMSTVDSASAAAGWNATSARGMVPFAACSGTAVGAGANSAAAIGVEVASALADGIVPLIESTAAVAATGVSPGVAICSGEIGGGAAGTGVAEAVEALPDEPNDKPCEQAARTKAPTSETVNIRFRRPGNTGPLRARSRVQACRRTLWGRRFRTATPCSPCTYDAGGTTSVSHSETSGTREELVRGAKYYSRSTGEVLRGMVETGCARCCLRLA